MYKVIKWVLVLIAVDVVLDLEFVLVNKRETCFNERKKDVKNIKMEIYS